MTENRGQRIEAPISSSYSSSFLVLDKGPIREDENEHEDEHEKEKNMITFNRSQLIEADFLDEETIRFNGVQQDHIYSMEINMDVRIADGQILAIEGLMKRYTNLVCPQAVPILQTAVGISVREEGWDRRVMKEIGRLGCEHFAEIIIECGRCFEQVQLTGAMWNALEKDPGLDQNQFMQTWLDKHPKYNE